MIANNILEIYTSLFAWRLYENIWNVLVGSGLALIPLIAAVVSNFRDRYGESDARATIKDLELKVVGMIIILMLCVIPFTPETVDLATVQYDLSVPDCNPPPNTQGQGNNTNQSYNNAFNNMNNFTVHKPVLWYFTEILSSAVTYSTIKSMSCVNNYDFMLMRVGHITIQDHGLRTRINDFHEQCYLKAMSVYEQNPVPIPANITPLQDLNWIGSSTLLANYYQMDDIYMVDMDKYGFTRNTNARPSDERYSSGAHPSCYEVWMGETNGAVLNGSADGLRELILEDIHDNDDEAGDIVDDWVDWGANVMTTGVVTDAVKEDLLIKLVLEADAANINSKTNIDLSNNFDANKSTSWMDGALSLLTAASSVPEFINAKVVMQMIKVSGPMLLALIQMVIILASPFVMTLGHYKLTAFMSVALAYFSFEFINVIWAASYWFDNHVLDIYLSEAGFIDKMTNSLLVMTISASAFVLLPMIWLSLIAYSGAGMVRGMGMPAPIAATRGMARVGTQAAGGVGRLGAKAVGGTASLGSRAVAAGIGKMKGRR